MNEQMKSITTELKAHAKILGGFVALIWVIEIVDTLVFRHSLDILGIIPRNPIGLRGILFSPFLHANFYHVAANTFPFLALGWFILLRGIGEFFFVSMVSALVSGIGTWLIGSPGVHIGASGMIFGYLGFLLFRGYFERRPLGIILSILAAFLYGGLIWGVLPGQIGISWEGHLFGFIGGILAARWLSTPKETQP